MGRYLSDQNKVAFLFESGTYAGSLAPNLFCQASTWVGQVQNLTLSEAQNKMETRYLGGADRNFQSFEDGPIDIDGTLTYNPQDINLFFHAIGSVQEANAGTTNTLLVTEVDSDVIQNPFIAGGESTLPYSFGLQDSKQTPGTGANFNRSIRGCVMNTVTLNLEQGEKASIDIDFIANHVMYDSGTTITIGSNDFNRAYHWSDTTLVLGGVGANAGSTIDTAKSISLEINQNVTAPHYLNGSRTVAEPFMGNRDKTLTVTADMDETLRAFYEKFYRTGSTFHGYLDLDADGTHEGAAGSQHTILNMSGCVVTSFDLPSVVEGVNEVTFEVRPQTITGSALQDERYVGSANPF